MITNSLARIVQNEVGSPEQKNLQIRPEEILKNIGPEMDLLEKFIIHDIDTDVELLNTVAHHILHAGGKRLRPALVLLASSLFESIEESPLRVAQVVEYLHTQPCFMMMLSMGQRPVVPRKRHARYGGMKPVS